MGVNMRILFPWIEVVKSHSTHTLAFWLVFYTSKDLLGNALKKVIGVVLFWLLGAANYYKILRRERRFSQVERVCNVFLFFLLIRIFYIKAGKENVSVTSVVYLRWWIIFPVEDQVSCEVGHDWCENRLPSDASGNHDGEARRILLMEKDLLCEDMVPMGCQLDSKIYQDNLCDTRALLLSLECAIA